MDQKDHPEIKGKTLKCLFCGGQEFFSHTTMLNKSWAAAFNLEIMSEVGQAYICKNCGYKHEFYADLQARIRGLSRSKRLSPFVKLGLIAVSILFVSLLVISFVAKYI